MLDDPWGFLLSVLEREEPLFGEGSSVHATPECWREIQKANFIMAAEVAKSVLCPNCSEEDALAVEYSPGNGPEQAPRVFCREAGWIDLDPGSLAQWRIDIAAFATSLSAALGLPEGSEEIVSDRLYRLGTSGGKGMEDVVFVRGPAWADGPALADRLGQSFRSESPIVLIAEDEVPAWLAKIEGVRVESLAAVARVREGSVEIQSSRLMRSVSEKGRSIARKAGGGVPLPSGIKPDEITLVVQDEKVIVKARDREWTVTSDSLGFSRADQSLLRLLKALADLKGRFTKSPSLKPKEWAAQRKRIQRLDAKLTTALWKKGKGIEFDTKNGCYVTRFRIRTAGIDPLGFPSNAMWSAVRIREASEGQLEFLAKARGRTDERKAYGEMSERTAAEEYRDFSVTRTLESLGLETDGRPNARGALLLRVLRSGGKIGLVKDEIPLLELGKFLGELAGIDEPAFEVGTNGTDWKSSFHASSYRAL